MPLPEGLNPTILFCVPDAQLFLLMRHILANEGFRAVPVLLPFSLHQLPEEEKVVAAFLHWTAPTPETRGFFNQLRLRLPWASIALLRRTVAGPSEPPPACDLLLESPFSPEKLIKFLVQLRSRSSLPAGMRMRNSVLRFADLEMNVSTCQVYRAGRSVYLTALQFRLLRKLLETPIVCDREQLIESCWPSGVEVEPRTVDIHVGHIRRALNTAGPDLIRTVRGTGYVLDDPGRHLQRPVNVPDA